MTPEERFEALAAVEGRALETVADEILACGVDVSVTAGPESVSAPVRIGVPGANATTVVLGHVALTRCTVLLDGVRGDGMRVGYDLPGAVAAAVCDAESTRGGGLSGRVHDLCLLAQESGARRGRARAGLVAMTRLEQA